MKPVAWRYENKNVKGNWYITWTEPPDGFNKRPLYEHPPQDTENACLFQMQEAATLREQVKMLRDAVAVLEKFASTVATEQKE